MAIKEGSKLNAIALGNPITAIIPASFDDVVRIARLALMAGLYKSERKTTPDELEAQAIMAIMKGMELGIAPMQALEGIAIINGRSCLWGDLVPALLWSNGFELEEGYENEDDPEKCTAVCTVIRPGGKRITRRFSIADAKNARLWDTREKVRKQVWENGNRIWKDGVDNDSTWFKYGKVRMLPMRARGYAARDGAPDVMRGMYMREEMEDMEAADEARDITPKRSLMIPSAEFLGTGEPQRTNDEAQLAASEDASQDAIPEDPKAVIEELRLALTGAHDAVEVNQAWDEMAERLTLAGRDAFLRAQELYDGRLLELAETAAKLQTIAEPQGMPASSFIAPKEKVKVRIPSVGI